MLRYINRGNLRGLLTFILGLLLTLLMVFELQEHGEQDQLNRLDDIAEQHAALIRLGVLHVNEEVESTAAFISDDFLEHDNNMLNALRDYQTFTRRITGDNAYVLALEWVPYVTHNRRVEFESWMRKAGFSDFHFIERGNDGAMLVASERDSYFPVYFIEPMENNEAAHGFDLGSNPVRLKAILAAMESGEATATESLRLLQAPELGNSFLYLYPVYKKSISEQGDKKIFIGITLAVLNVEMLVRNSVAALKQKKLHFSVYDVDGSQQDLLYTHGKVRGSTEPVTSKFIKVADRSWRIDFWTEDSFVSEDRKWVTLATLFAGVALSLLLGLYLNVLQGRNRTIQQRVDEQTRELRNSIQERQHAEQEVRKLNVELERRVEKRTAELATSNRELEAFCYSVSHDLRAPLRSMGGFSNILIEDYGAQIDAMGQSHLQRIAGSARQMGTLIDDLLNLSRINREAMSREKVNLTLLAGEFAELLQEQEPERQLEFTIQDDVFGYGDKHLLRLVMQNLFENAVKYSAKEDVSRIVFGVNSSANGQLYFVRDNGVGFDMDHANKIFQPFQRLHAMSEFEGTGIGLATVHRIIERHQGRIWCEAEVGQGAVFYFELGFER